MLECYDKIKLLLIVVVKLSYFGGYFSYLPSFQSIFSVKDLSMLLLKFPEFCINIESSTKVCLPLFVPILRQISETFETCKVHDTKSYAKTTKEKTEWMRHSHM